MRKDAQRRQEEKEEEIIFFYGNKAPVKINFLPFYRGFILSLNAAVSLEINLKNRSILNTEMEEFIIIRGAKEHNLKNISLSLPRNKFIVVTGLSGSGKSSLAFDTIYAEGQRRYVESLSS